MGRLVTSVTVLILCFVMCIGEYSYLKASLDVLYTDLQRCAELITDGDSEKAISETAAIEESFEKINRKISVIIGDELIDELRYKIPSIRELISEGNEQKALEILHECSYIAREIPRAEKLSLDNVF